MYCLVFGTPDNHRVLARGSLIEVVRQRWCSGDLVLNPAGHVVKGLQWLFPWERANPLCYARQQQIRWTR